MEFRWYGQQKETVKRRRYIDFVLHFICNYLIQIEIEAGVYLKHVVFGGSDMKTLENCNPTRLSLNPRLDVCLPTV
jgi:hypothetical protein